MRTLVKDRNTLAILDEACREWGFFYVTGHGIDHALCDAILEQARKFFALPPTAKQRIARTETNVWGFYDQELTKNTRDWKEIFDVGPAESEGPVAGARPQWPEALPELERTLPAYMNACRRVGHGVLEGISMNLGVPGDYLSRWFRERDSSFLRLNYYPICESPAPANAPTLLRSGHLGINHHTDAGALTILLQDEHAGLQVRRENGWVLIEPRPEALLINIGDIVQVWSNDVYEAPLHRVIASSRTTRYSAPFFFNPAYETDYAPLPSSRSRAPHYRSINWGEFRAARAAGDYADHGQEIQIADFRCQ